MRSMRIEIKKVREKKIYIKAIIGTETIKFHTPSLTLKWKEAHTQIYKRSRKTRTVNE